MPDSIGALWKRASPKGEFLSGHITIDGKKTEIICFVNKTENPKAPAYNILQSIPKETIKSVPMPGIDAGGVSSENIPF